MIKKTYIWYHDRKVIGLLILSFAVAFQLFAFLKVPGLTTMHGYTIGMLIGFYNPFFYLFVSYVGLRLLFEDKWKQPKWIKFNATNYWIIVMAIIFVSVSTTFYQEATSYTSFGSRPWSSFKKWYGDFTSESNAWFPINTNGGILGAFLYSIVAMLLSGIGAFIISIMLIISSFTYFGLKSWFAFRDKRIKKPNPKAIAASKKIDKKTTVTNKNDSQTYQKQTSESKNPDKKTSEGILPFDDPFLENKK